MRHKQTPTKHVYIKTTNGGIELSFAPQNIRYLRYIGESPTLDLIRRMISVTP